MQNIIMQMLANFFLKTKATNRDNIMKRGDHNERKPTRRAARRFGVGANRNHVILQSTAKEEYMKEDIFDYLMGRAEYAIKSKSLALTHETYGQAKMARKLLAITKEQFWELNKILVRNGINNPAAGLE